MYQYKKTNMINFLSPPPNNKNKENLIAWSTMIYIYVPYVKNECL